MAPSRKEMTRSAISLDDGVVGDDRHGGAQLAIDARQRFQDEDAGPGVQGPGRFVAQHDLRPFGDRAGNRHALLLAAGKLGRKMAGPVLQPNHRQCLVGGHRRR
jgi:hypothetical protein